MNLKYFLIIFYFIISFINNTQSQNSKISSKDLPVDAANNSKNVFSKEFNQSVLKLEGEIISGDYWFGPEIEVDGATGFYDFQSNGDCRHYINRFDATTLHAAYMISTDSLNINTSVKTAYSYSADDGNSWTFVTFVPSILSTMPSLTCLLNDGSAIITSNVGSPVNSSQLFYDVAPGAGSFTGYSTPTMIYNTGCARLSNGKILVTGTTMLSNVITDSSVVTVYDPVSHLFSYNYKFKAAPGVNQTNMRTTYAAGPSGKGLIVISPVLDNGGNAGKNRIFISLTNDNGQSWSSPVVLYNPANINGQFAVPYLGLDAVYDNSGNYYVCFNTTDTNGNYSSAKLWVTKNGGTPVEVVHHDSISGTANTLLNPQNGVCTIDNPSISVSTDGFYIIVSYSVMFQNDTLNGFNKSHIFLNTSPSGNMNFTRPIKITNSGSNSFDERYSSLNKISPDLGGNHGLTAYIVYQKDVQPGSCITDNAPVSRTKLIFRKIYDLYPVFGIIYNNNEIPLISNLIQNYPNPFNPETKIEFELSALSKVTLSVFDVNGRLIENIYNNENARAGKYESIFNGSKYSSGVYFVRLSIEDADGKISIFSKKMLMIK